MLRCRCESASRYLHYAHRILGCHELRAGTLQVDFRAPETRQDQCLFSRHQMRAVQLDADVGSEASTSQGRGGIFRVWRRG
jgi:hypothetical protein